MDVPDSNHRFGIDDIRHPSDFPDPNTDLLAPIRPRMPQLPIYRKFNETAPENDLQAAGASQEKDVQVCSEMGAGNSTDPAAAPPPARAATETDSLPQLLPREGVILPQALVEYDANNAAIVNPQETALKSTSEGEKWYHEATTWEFDAVDERLLDVFLRRWSSLKLLSSRIHVTSIQS